MDDETNKLSIQQNDAKITAQLTADIVCAYVSNNTLPASELPILLTNVCEMMTKIMTMVGTDGKSEIQKNPIPAVPIKKSVKSEKITCLECGLEFKSLKKHLRASHDLSPEEYRKKWALPFDYPMVASAYAERRSELAKSLGLGRKP